MTRRWPALGLVLAVLWLFVRGVTPGPTVEATLRHVAGEFLIGLAVGLPVAYSLRYYYADEFALDRSLRAVPAAVAYVLVFLRELLTANVDVAYRVLSPSMPIEPAVVAVPLRVESDLAVTTIANSITLTPGTLTMDHDDETNTLYVHAIAAEDTDSVLAPIRTWEDYALVVFEGRDPDTPVPRRRPAGGVTDESGSEDGASGVNGGNEGSTSGDGEDTADHDGDGGETDGR